MLGLTIPVALYGGIGAVLGFLFAVLYKKLPGGTPMRKGVILPVVSWFALNLVGAMISSEGGGPIPVYGNITNLYMNIMGNASWALFGLMLGHFWKRFSGENEKERCDKEANRIG
ncbi:hypothetical protein AKJ61_01705 [candidate division MSBL1 archaeon SCGC-AAA259B11]|uniref:Uncharacterized protein n=1 Tax=candidate division MSBL1 archaeon SCGC-AAA259B11 TaxID=1698260 RepID=A0A133U746_9EURY|nr:hypothetical protein AKJ61_01705 [candidate division MSBL1 archaeon SCGC-AAA259B11]